MPDLQEGSTGPDVEALQIRLQTLGFNPGAVDGIFGPATEAAVMAFQQSEGLLADGVVANRTATALDLSQPPPRPPLPGMTVAIASKMCPGAPIGNINEHLPHVLAALEARDLTDRSIVLACIATIRVETGRFEPIDEFRSKFNTSPGGHPFDLYDNRKDLGNRGRPDGDRFKGRGYIQLTGRFNYEKFGERLGVDLIEAPERANEPAIAAALLAEFIKAKELPMKQALLEDDLRRARRLVNGGSHGLDGFIEAYRIGQKLLT